MKSLEIGPDLLDQNLRFLFSSPGKNDREATLPDARQKVRVKEMSSNGFTHNRQELSHLCGRIQSKDAFDVLDANFSKAQVRVKLE